MTPSNPTATKYGWRAFALLFIPLLSTAPAQALAGPIVLERAGRISVNEQALGSAIHLPKQASLTIGPKGRLLVLASPDLQFFVAGPASLEVKAATLVVKRAEHLFVAGKRGSVRLMGRDIALSWSDSASLVLTAGGLRVLAGQVRAHRPCSMLSPATSPATQSAPAPCFRQVIMQRGESLAFGTKSRAPTGARLAHHATRYSAPPAWHPTLTVTPKDIKRAQQWVAASQARQQELASCGCTEGASRGATGSQTTQTGLSPIERQATKLTIRVEGLPKRVLP